MRETDILIIHNKPEDASVLVEELCEKYAFDYTKISYAKNASDAIPILEKGLKPKVIITHKEFDDGKDIFFLTEKIKQINHGDLVRIGVVSGEFFGEQVCSTALAAGANFGWDMTDYDGPVPDWVATVITLGYLHPQELPLLGQEIVLSRNSANKRLELLGRPPVKERSY